MALALETLLKRQKEIFEVFIANKGREVSLLPLVQKYRQEEGENHKTITFSKIYDYLRLYVSSNNISPSELEVYTRVTTMSDETKIKRGEEIVRLLVANRCDWREVSALAIKYAKEDGRIRSYTSETMKEWRSLFLINNKNDPLTIMYRKVLELSRNRTTQGYDILLLDKIVECPDLTSAMEFVRSIKISRTSLMDLLSAYRVVYPTKTDEQAFLIDCINGVFAKSQNTQRYNPTIDPKKTQKLNNFKELLEEYTITDIEDIDTILGKHNFTKYSFNEFLKDQRASNDKVLQLLIDKYDLKTMSINARRSQELETILGYILNGICYGKEFLKFNSYDLKMTTDLSWDDIIKYATRLLRQGELVTIRRFIENITANREYETPEELVEAVNYGITGTMATLEDKWTVAEFMTSQGWPYNAQLFTDTLARYLHHDIAIQKTMIPSTSETEEIVGKMNK